jgi:hypothetical protein
MVCHANKSKDNLIWDGKMEITEGLLVKFISCRKKCHPVEKKLVFMPVFLHLNNALVVKTGCHPLR